MDLDGAIDIALKALSHVIEGELDPTKVEIAVIRAEDKEFEKLSPEEVQEYIDKSRT